MDTLKGRSFEHREIRSPEISRIDTGSIKDTLPTIGGTDITLQRHGDYIRSPEHESVGSLTPEAREEVTAMVRQKVNALLKDADQEANVAFLVTGSATRHYGKGQRSIETAEIVREEISRALSEHGMRADLLLNNRSARKGVAPIKKVRAPQFVDTMNPYFEFLLGKHDAQMGEAFWKDFESDTYKQEREAFCAEGPDDIDQRFTRHIKALKRFASSFHQDNAGHRLIIWNVSHYDTIAPFAKRHIDHSDKDIHLPVELGGGLTLEIRGAEVTTELCGHLYTVT